MNEVKNIFTIKNIIFLIFILLIIKFICSVKDFALLLFASFVIAASLNPLVDKLQKKMSRSKATIFALAIFCSVIGIAFIPLIAIVIDQIQPLIASIPEKMIMIQNFIATKVILGTKLSTIFTTEQLPNAPTEMISNAVQKTVAASVSVISSFAIMFIITMIVFYMLNDKTEMKNWILKLFPPAIREKTEEVFVTITNRVGGFVIAQSASMLAVGLVTSIGLLLLGIPYALALGLIAGLLDIVPVVGPILATGLAISVGYSKGWVIIIAIIAICAIAQWISNNFIRPLIFGKFMELHPLVILLSFLIAAKFLDVWGVILAPAIAAVFAVLFDEIYIKQINKDTENSTGEEQQNG